MKKAKNVFGLVSEKMRENAITKNKNPKTKLYLVIDFRFKNLAFFLKGSKGFKAVDCSGSVDRQGNHFVMVTGRIVVS